MSYSFLPQGSNLHLASNLPPNSQTGLNSPVACAIDAAEMLCNHSQLTKINVNDNTAYILDVLYIMLFVHDVYLYSTLFAPQLHPWPGKDSQKATDKRAAVHQKS